MNDEQNNSQIGKIANMMVEDNYSIDEQGQDKLEKYRPNNFRLQSKWGLK